MRCPKCQYISFDSGGRCRNCGYEFSLSPEDPQIDVTIGRDEPRSGRLDEMSLSAFDPPLSGSRRGIGAQRADDLEFDEARVPFRAEDLPLFTERVADDQAPLVTPPAVPRQPLSVRRGAPVRPRARNPLPEELELDLADWTDEGQPARVDDDGHRRHASGATASVVRRVAAEAIDACLLGAIQAGVVYLTLRACGLTPEQWRVLPLIPLIAFMLLLCGGYFVLFTAAGGQTVGKMITGIRVVAVPAAGEGPLRVSFGAAVVRTVASLASLLLLGAGFLPVLFSTDRRALHDRLAETRVVVA